VRCGKRAIVHGTRNRKRQRGELVKIKCSECNDYNQPEKMKEIKHGTYLCPYCAVTRAIEKKVRSDEKYD